MRISIFNRAENTLGQGETAGYHSVFQRSLLNNKIVELVQIESICRQQFKLNGTTMVISLVERVENTVGNAEMTNEMYLNKGSRSICTSCF